MSNEKISTSDVCDAGLVKGSGHSELTSISGYYVAECYDASGKLKWKDEIHNLVTTAGKNKVMDTILGNTAAGAVVLGLKGTGTAVVADTQASHASWSEVGLANAPAYGTTRPTPTFGAASAGAKATSSAVSFTFTSAGTVAGCFINIGGTSGIDNTTGTLFSAGDFTGGSKTVANTDQLNVTYTATAA
jgi:hypothetical protein